MITIVPPTKAEKLRVAKHQYNTILEMCRSRYNIKPFAVKWDGRGSSRLGYCKFTRDGTVLFVRFNIEYLYDDKSFLEMVNNTIAHELAHAVVISRQIKETAHGPEWRRVCIELGGSGHVCAPRNLHTVVARIRKQHQAKRKTVTYTR